jgi:type III secretory pathway component EscV
MKAASLKQLRDELKIYSPEDLQLLCIRLAKYKKDNKELLSYLLFEADDEAAYIQSVKDEIDSGFESLNRKNTYLIKKSLRKILKDTTKYIKYSGIKTTELDLLIYYCRKIRTSKIPLNRSLALRNIYARQVIKIENLLKKLHEDIQFDYQDDVRFLKA